MNVENWPRTSPAVVPWARIASIAFLTLSCAGGGESTGPTGGGASGGGAVVVAATITLDPSTATMAVGESRSISAIARSAAGATLTDRTITWTTSDSTIARVSGGMITAMSAGSATITAAADGRSASATITVMVPVASINVSPATATMVVGNTQQFTATPRDAAGAAMTGQTTTWTTSSASVATVSATGNVTAVAAGSVTITAEAGGKSATGAVTVNAFSPVNIVGINPNPVNVAVGDTRQLTALLRDGAGNDVTGQRPVTWSTSAAGVATVSATGLVTGVANGTATVTGTSEGKSGTTQVTVGGPVQTIVIAPTTATVATGATTTLVATLRDAAGTTLIGRALAWTSGSPAVATVSSTGVVTGVGGGTATITAASEGRTATAQVSVTGGSGGSIVGSVTITPDTTTEIAGGVTRQLSAIVRDAAGVVLSGQPIIWTTSDALLATVSSTGLLTPKQKGIVTITATSGGKSGKVVVGVSMSPWPVKKITVSASRTGGITVGAEMLVSALVEDKFSPAGNFGEGRVVTWTSSNPAIATVGPPSSIATFTGGGAAETRVVGVSAGTVTITGSVDGVSASTTVTVIGSVTAPLDVAVDWSGIDILIGGSRTLAATVFRGDGQPWVGGTVTWTTSAPGVATVVASSVTDARGIASTTVRGVSVGTARVTVTAGSIMTSGTVNVALVMPVRRVNVGPGGRMTPGMTTQLTATLFDAYGVVLTGRPITWTTSDARLATVSATGLVTAVSIGWPQITATSEGVSGYVNMEVFDNAGSVSVSPSTQTIAVGAGFQLTATVRNSAGTVLPNTVTWTTSNATVATVSSTGIVGGRANGVATIMASSGGQSGTATITVGTGGGTTGGGTGGGGTTPPPSGGATGICDWYWQFPTPAKGQATAWASGGTFLPNISVRIRAGLSNTGSDASPKYQYFFEMQNNYSEKVWFGFRGPSIVKPTDTGFSGSTAATATESVNSEYWELGPTTMHIYIARVRFGATDGTATSFCK